MSFETGGDMQDPFEDEEEEGSQEGAESRDVTEDSARSAEVETETETQSPADSPEEGDQLTSQSGSSRGDETTREQSSEPSSDLEVPYIKDVDVTKPMSTVQLARALMMPAYHEENPPVPYSVWREGTSTGRSRTTIELNSDVDELVKQVLHEFDERYDTNIHKADVRELALVYGLTHLDEIFEMAEEWGIQYNS